ncbi:hypothetical protein L5515_005937 [Caenorhabditis briggsae]|uniref:Protein MAK10 homolog n=1 Tax=Caenorhabditis briggsae TaxID=6238 RepID=A0AAE9F352_CAEBR|nr:hypothetical protein L5515_005937 [Caenorhabditis briggsae]
METGAGKEDVSREFFKLCEGLSVGEMVTTPKFTLLEVMSAIELMEPKMDVGVGASHLKTLDDAIADGLYGDDMPMQLAVMDATLAMVVAWLEGSSLGTTVWTNVMLANVAKITHPLFHPFAAGINLLVRNIYSLVNNVGNLEELPEDFNPQNLFNNQTWMHRRDIIIMMREQMHALERQGASWSKETGSRRAVEICTACSARLEFVTLMLDIMSYLMPPEIENPHFDHKIYVGGHEPISEKDYEDLEKLRLEDAEEQREEPKEDTVEDTSPGKKEHKKNGKKQKRKKNKKHAKQAKKESPKTSPTKPEEEKPNSSSANPAESEDVDDEEEYMEDEDDCSSCDDPAQFTPNFQFAAVLSDRLIQISHLIKNTVILGRRGPDNEDGDYKWLMPFDSKACVRMIPACFPRSVKYPTRMEAAVWWTECAQRIYDLSRLPPKSTKDINMLFFFAQQFTVKSCVFTRSLLQVIMFPTDAHLMGGNTTCAEPIEDSLKNNFMPQVLDKDSPVHDDPLARQLYLNFLNQMSKLAVNVYSSFGCNLSRQRDRLEMALEELAHIQFYAGQVEKRTDEVMIAAKMIDSSGKEQNSSFHSIASFVFHNLVGIIHYYFELGFRMDLFVPYEFPYIFWFLGEIDAKWMMTTMERSQEIQLNYWKGSSLSTTLNQRRQKEKQAREADLKRRFVVHQFNVLNQYAISLICEGIVKLSVILIRKGIVRVPDGGDEAERLRFERRFEPLQNLGPPLNVNYEQFKAKTRIDELYQVEMNDLIDAAAENFNQAKANLEQLDNTVEQNRTNLFVDTMWSMKRLLNSSELLQITKSNMVACRLLKMMNLEGRKVEWTYPEQLPMYPYLSIK